MADRYAKADELLKTLERFNGPEGSCNNPSDMEPSRDGDYVRFEDVCDLLYRSVDEALMRREP